MNLKKSLSRYVTHETFQSVSRFCPTVFPSQLLSLPRIKVNDNNLPPSQSWRVICEGWFLFSRNLVVYFLDYHFRLLLGYYIVPPPSQRNEAFSIMNTLVLVFVWWTNQNSFVYDPGCIISVAGGRKFWQPTTTAARWMKLWRRIYQGEGQPEGINRI